MELLELLSRLATALGIGLLIGLDRGWKTREAAPGSRAAGIRTFTLCGLVGGVSGALGVATGSGVASMIVVGIAFAVYGAIIVIFERDANAAAGSYSATTTIAALLTFLLGAYAVIGDLRLAAAGAVTVAVVLAARQQMHDLVARITWPELRSALVLLAMTFIILPVMPDEAFGPNGGINPREVWLIAIVLAGVSFLGYGAVKLFGAERGILLASIAGGLVSSTAVTASNARHAADAAQPAGLLAAGVSIATAISFARVVAIVVALNPSLLRVVAPALGAASIVALGHAGLVIWRRSAEDAPSDPPSFKNPFSFWPVVGFAVFLGVVILLAEALGATFGAGGALIGAAALGLADVDAVAVSMVRLAPSPLTPAAAGGAILVAVATNMATKLGIAVSAGRGSFAKQVAAVSLGSWIAGGLAFWAASAILRAG